MTRFSEIAKIAILAASAAAITAVFAVSMMVPAYAGVGTPAPEADDNTIAKKVAETIVYQDQEQATAIKTIVNDLRDDMALARIHAQAEHRRAHSPANDHDDALGYTAADETVVSDEEIEEAVTEPLQSTTHEEVSSVDEMSACQISVNGDVLSWIDYYKESAAPAHGAGLWLGSDDVDDGSWGYFIGHNPGDFTAVMTLKTGDPITVCDRNGDTRTYHVVDSFDVKNTTYFNDISDKVCGYGESVIVQTCCGDNLHYRVVVAV